MNTATYTKLLKDGTYEYGLVLQNKGKRDKVVFYGIARSYDSAAQLASELK